MPVEIELTAAGVFGWLAANPGGLKQARITKAVRAAADETLTKWGNQKGMVGLEVRFSERGFDLLDLTERSKGYRKRQMNVLGHELPYASPTRHSGHMRAEVLGGGWNVSHRNGGGQEVTSRFTVTGARQLNQIAAPWGPVYRSEFLNLAKAPRDEEWIMATFRSLVVKHLFAEIQNAPRRRLVAASAGAAA